METDSEGEDEETSTQDNQFRRLYTFQEYDKEIDSLIQDSSLSFRNPVGFSQESTSRPGVFDDELKLFEIELGSCLIPRYSCACHKLNLTVREAIANNHELSHYIELINHSVVSIRKSVKKSVPFRLKKAKLRRESTTRWSSTLLMLESVIRAFLNGLFVDGVQDERRFPVELAKIEAYYQVLLPVQMVNLEFQKIESSIAEVIPGKINNLKLNFFSIVSNLKLLITDILLF